MALLGGTVDDCSCQPVEWQFEVSVGERLFKLLLELAPRLFTPSQGAAAPRGTTV